MSRCRLVRPSCSRQDGVERTHPAVSILRDALRSARVDTTAPQDGGGVGPSLFFSFYGVAACAGWSKGFSKRRLSIPPLQLWLAPSAELTHPGPGEGVTTCAFRSICFCGADCARGGLMRGACDANA